MRTTKDVVVAYEKRLQAVLTIEASGGDRVVRQAVAKAVDVKMRTIGRWLEKYRKGTLRPTRLGRRPKSVPRSSRQGVIRALLKHGPLAGVNVIRAMFPGVPYRQIADMKRRLKAVIRRRRGWWKRRLKWLRAGAVWAMDFTQPKGGLAGGMRKVFMVRDLASGKRLASVVCAGELAAVVVATLTTLFALYGVPLVIKHDNGGAFRAAVTQDLLTDRQVTSLPSPPYTPEYNGSIERSIGCDKQRAEHIALIDGRCGNFTQSDFEQARALANHTARPWGACGPTPAERFAAKTPISSAEREAFQRTWREHERKALMTRDLESSTMAHPMKLCAIKRKAIQRALCELAYLKIRRGRISTPFST